MFHKDVPPAVPVVFPERTSFTTRHHSPQLVDPKSLFYGSVDHELQERANSQVASLDASSLCTCQVER